MRERVGREIGREDERDTEGGREGIERGKTKGWEGEKGGGGTESAGEGWGVGGRSPD